MTAKTTGRALRGRFAGLLLVLVIISIAASIFGQGKIHDLIAAAGFATLLLFAIRHGSRGSRSDRAAHTPSGGRTDPARIGVWLHHRVSRAADDGRGLHRGARRHHEHG